MVTMDGAGISIDGARVGDLPADALAIVDPLQKKLEERREAWTKEHPGKTFPNALTVQLGPDVTCRQALSVLGTARTSGYDIIVFKHEATTLALPIHAQEKESERGREKAVTIELRGDGSAWLTPEQCGGAFDIVPAQSLPATVQEWCGTRGDCLREVGFTCDAGMPVAKVLPVINAVVSGSRSATFRASGSCDSPPRSSPEPPPWADRSASPPVPVAPPRNSEEALKTAISTAVRGDPYYAPPPPNAGEARPAATLGGAEVTATGALTAEEARETLKPVPAQITACYEAGLERDHLLDGRVVATLEVGKKGAVMWATSAGSDMPDPAVLRCASMVLATVTFPSKGAVAKVGYSVTMSPGPAPSGASATKPVPPPQPSASARPSITTVRVEVPPDRLPPGSVERSVRGLHGRWRACYEEGLRKNPRLAGGMAVLFTINPDGTPSNVGNGVYTLQDQAVVSCVVRTFWRDFPKPEGGSAWVKYHLYFAPPKK